MYSKILLSNAFIEFELNRLEKEICDQKKDIQTKTTIVESELVEAKPALEAAHKAVANINKKHLNEVKSIRNPPILFEMTMIAVTTLMGKKVKDWRGMQKVMASRDFIQSILKFDTNKVQEMTRRKINKEFISNEDFTFEKVNETSKVAGPLVLWVRAQVKFAYLLDSVEPMTKEIRALKAKLTADEKEAEEWRGMLI